MENGKKLYAPWMDKMLLGANLKT